MDLTDSIRLLLARSNRFLGGRIRFRTRLQPLLYIFFFILSPDGVAFQCFSYETSNSAPTTPSSNT